MKQYEFGKHRLTDAVAHCRELQGYWTGIFRDFVPDIFATLTYEDPPPHVADVLSEARKHIRHVAGALRQTVLPFSVVEQGIEGGRLHVHELIWTPSAPTRRDLQLFRRKWRYGKSDFQSFDPTRGGIDYIGKKIARGEQFHAPSKFLAKLQRMFRKKM